MTLTNVVTSMPASSTFRTPFTCKRVHGSQALLEPAPEIFYLNFPLIQDKTSSKTSPLVRFKILGLFANSFTADRMYSCHIWEKLPQHIQMVFSKKRKKLFCNFYCIFAIYKKFCWILTKRSASSLKYFGSYCPWQIWLLQCS